MINVRSTPREASASNCAVCSGLGSTNWRAVRSAAITVRASLVSIPSKLWLNPRTPLNAPTPAATPNTTNENFTIDDLVSRHAIRAAVLKERFIAGLLQQARESGPRRSCRPSALPPGPPSTPAPDQSASPVTSVVRSRWFRSSSSCSTCCPFTLSRFPVGSSAIRMGGFAINARASATLCCSPPESWIG